MATFIDKYVEASGANPEVITKFYILNSQIPKLSDDSRTAAIQVKEYIYKLGFQYGGSAFKIQDMLEQKRGNCLGLPLLIGTILGERGFTPRFKIVTGPRDFTYNMEGEFARTLAHEIPYDKPPLLSRSQINPRFRFTPLEHLVIEAGDSLIETTTHDDNSVPSSESVRSIDFNGGLSCIYQVRAAYELDDGNLDNVKKLTQKGLDLWRCNRSLYVISANRSFFEFDDQGNKFGEEKFNETSVNDSLDQYTKFVFTSDQRFFDEALKIYPAYAQPVVVKADSLGNVKPLEARFLYSYVSYLYANSAELDLGNFYVANCSELIKLFGADVISNRLEEYSDDKWGEFSYHIAMYNVSHDEKHFREAEEAMKTPFQRLELLAAAIRSNNSVYSQERVRNELESMDRQFGESNIYKDTKKALNIFRPI